VTSSFDDHDERPAKSGELSLSGDSFVRAGTGRFDGRGSKPLMDPELGEDFFERQAREQKEKARAAGTKPLSGPAMTTFLENTVAKADTLVQSLEARVELLMLACRMAKKPIPGVEFGEPKHPITPSTQKIVQYLVRALQMKPPLLKRVQVAVFRFHEAVEVIDRARVGLETDALEDGILEELKLKVYYLTNFHEEFRIDPVLTQVFPPPKDGPPRPGTGGALKPGTGTISPAELAQQRQSLEVTFHQAQQVVNELAGHLAFFVKAIELAESGKTGNLSGLFSDPATKRAQACAKAIKSDPMLMVKLKGDRKLYDELLARTKESYRTAQLEPLKETLEAFQRLRASWLQQAALREFMVPPEAGSKKKG
jgi:hypothetical protein